jgi:hypothetical protein
MNERGETADRVATRLAAHRRECESCRLDPPAEARIAAALAQSPPAVDAAALSAAVLTRVSTELAARAQAVFRRQVMVVLLLALVPLPGLLFFGGYGLFLAYELIARVLPKVLAEYLVISYAASALVVLTASYASIPILLQRLRAQPAARHGYS